VQTETPETLDLAQALNNEKSESTSPVSQSSITVADGMSHIANKTIVHNVEDATDTIHKPEHDDVDVSTKILHCENHNMKKHTSKNGNESEEKLGNEVKFREVISRTSSSGIEIMKDSEGNIRRLRRLDHPKSADSSNSSSGELIKLTSENRLGTITSLPQVLEETEDDGDAVQIFAPTTGKFSLEKIGSFTMSPCPKCGRKISQGAMKRHEKFCYVETRP